MDLTNERLAKSLERIATEMEVRGLLYSPAAMRKEAADLRAGAEKEKPGVYGVAHVFLSMDMGCCCELSKDEVPIIADALRRGEKAEKELRRISPLCHDGRMACHAGYHRRQR